VHDLLLRSCIIKLMDSPYISLYRKYRPQTFAELAGEEHVTKTLVNAIKQGRVSHAYLFAGPRGTGKTSTAKILAKAMNCEKGPTPEPDNTCPSCLEISAGSAVDVLEIDAASNRGIDEIRELRDKVHFAPTRGRYKVYIIDEVHMLTTEAFNALLKMLEEPPAHAIFVLATTEPHKVLPTILSRCQRFDFRRIGTSDIIRRLEHIAESEGIEIDQGALVLIASHSQGSLRDAISDIDQLMAYCGKTITMDDVAGALGLVPYEQLADFADLIVECRPADALRMIAGLVDSGQDLREFVGGLLGHFRNLFVIKSTGAEDILDLPEEHLSRLRNQADAISVPALDHALALLSEAHNEMRFSSNPRLALEVVTVKVVRSGGAEAVEERHQRKSRKEEAAAKMPAERVKAKAAGAGGKETEAKVAEAGVPQGTGTAGNGEEAVVKTPAERADAETRPAEMAPAAGAREKAGGKGADSEQEAAEVPEGLSPAKAHRAWKPMLQAVKKRRVPTYSLLLECEPRTRDDVLVLRFNKRAAFHKGEVEKAANMRIVEEAAEEVFGTKVRIECELADEDPAKLEEAPPELLPETDMPSHHIKKVMHEKFGATMVEEITNEE